MSSLKMLSRNHAVLVAVAAVFGLTGCTQAETEAAFVPASDWVEPDWMESARLEVANYHAEMLSCFDEFGVIGRPAPGSAMFTGGVIDADGNRPAEAFEIEQAAWDECEPRVGTPSLWSAPIDTMAYQRMLDTRACLVAHGFEIPDAPSQESWLAMINPWNPWSWFARNDSPWLDSQELETLMDRCPQSGANLQVILG